MRAGVRSGAQNGHDTPCYAGFAVDIFQRIGTFAAIAILLAGALAGCQRGGVIAA
jgi:hypothetical protein